MEEFEQSNSEDNDVARRDPETRVKLLHKVCLKHFYLFKHINNISFVFYAKHTSSGTICVSTYYLL